MSKLSGIEKKTEDRPITVLIHGKGGVGKSTFASDSPEPLFFDVEHSTTRLTVSRYPFDSAVPTWGEVINGIDDVELNVKRYPYKSLVIDTWDVLEMIAQQDLLQSSALNPKHFKSVEDWAFGGANKILIDQYWRPLLWKLERIRGEGLNIISIAHSAVRTVNNPNGADYDTFDLKVSPRLAAMLHQWHESVVFADEEKAVTEGKGLTKTKAISDGTRVMYTEGRPGFLAKNRFNLPFKMPLDWSTFYDRAVGAGSETPQEIIDRIIQLASGTKFESSIKANIAKAGQSKQSLRALENVVRTKLAPTEQASAKKEEQS